MSRAGWIERSAWVLTAGLVLTGASTLVPAAQLDEKTCAQLKLEIGQLEGLGARDNLAKGATWGKANLRGNQLEQVKKLIEMDETVAFRCPRPKPVVAAASANGTAAKGKVIAKVLPKTTTGKTAKAGDPAAATAAPSTAAPAVAAPRTKPKAKPAANSEAGDAAQDKAAPAVQQPTPPAAKPRPKPAAPKAPDPAASGQ